VRAAVCAARLRLPGVDLAALMAELPPNRYQVYH